MFKFVECSNCEKLPGMAELCDSCLTNRHAIDLLRRDLDREKIRRQFADNLSEILWDILKSES